MTKEFKTSDLGIAFPDRTASGVVRKTVTLGSGGGFCLTRRPDLVGRVPYESPLIQNIHTIFTLEGFEKPRAPFVIAQGDLREVPKNTEFFGLPIKFPGTEYRVPNELTYAKSILEQCASYEEKINPNLKEYYSYLSLYNTYVKKGERQLSAGLHSDGIQGRRVEPKVAIEHGYAFTNSDPTKFFPHAFDMTGVDVNQHLMDAVFESQVDRDKAVTYPSDSLIFFDAYNVHQAVPASEPGWRTFFKLMYTPRQYDRIGNAFNKLFEEDYRRENWEFQPRPIPADLTVPENIK